MGKKDSKKVIPEIVHLLPREIRGITQWGLRAAKIPAGYSPAAEKMVLDCELFQQKGLAELQSFLSEEIVPAVRVHLISDTGSVAQIRAQQQNVLICAPAVFDFASARVRENGRFLITVQELAGGFPFLTELAFNMAKNGVACVALWNTEDCAGATAAFPDEQGNVVLYISPQTTPTTAHLLCNSAKLSHELPKGSECLTHLFSPVTEPVLDASLHNSFSLYCLDQELYSPAQWDSEFKANWGEGQTASSRSQLTQTAEEKGVVVSGDLWDALKTYGNQILIEKV